MESRADKIILGTVAPRKEDIERVVMEVRADIYRNKAHLKPTRWPVYVRNETRSAAQCAVRLMLMDGQGNVPFVPDNQLTQEEFLEEYGILTLQGYREAVSNYSAIRQHHDRNYFPINPETVRFITLPRDPQRYTADFEGWLRYLTDIEPRLMQAILSQRMKVPFPARVRDFHTCVAAPNGWGKSELLKALAFHDIQHATGSLIVVDPAGDMVSQIARFPELSAGDRLVLLQPELIPGQYPCLNPLDVRGFNETQKAGYAETLGGALSLIAGDALTGNMRLVAVACIRVLLDRPGSTLADLADMLVEPERAKAGAPTTPSPRTALIELGEGHSDPVVATFFRHQFDAGSLRSSKSGLYNRLIGLLMLPGFRAMTCGPSTVDLEQLVEARKVVLFNLSLIGDAARFAFGRLLLALVEDIGQRRARLGREDRTPVQLIVDEATMMVSPTMLGIINKLRKFGVHLTLAQQVGGQDFDTDGRRVLASVGCKFAGTNSPRELVQMFEEEGRGLPQLERGEFWVKWGEGAPIRLAVRSDLADFAHSASEEAWQKTVAAQAQYYRLPDSASPAVDYVRAFQAGRRSAPAGRRGGPPTRSGQAWENLEVD